MLHSNWNSLEQALISLWKSAGMQKSDMCYTSNETFSDVEATTLFGHARRNDEGKVLKRGQVYCKKISQGCSFCVPFSYLKKPGYYRIQEFGKKVRSAYLTGKFTHNLCHNHSHTCGTTLLDGVAFTQDRKNLTSTEISLIQQLSTGVSNQANQIQVTLREQFPDRSFDSKLIRRVKTDYLDKIWGVDRHRIADFINFGMKLASEGGTSVPEVCRDSLVYEGGHIQTKLMKEYAQTYGQYFACIDGTHGTNQYGLIYVPHTSVDCLGKSVIVGVSFMRTENGVDIKKGLTVFSMSGLPAKFDDDDDDVATAACHEDADAEFAAAIGDLNSFDDGSANADDNAGADADDNIGSNVDDYVAKVADGEVTSCADVSFLFECTSVILIEYAN